MTDRKVYAAIGTAMAEIAKEGIGKSRANQQQGYKFRGVDEVMNALAPVLVKAKLAIMPRYTERSAIERPTQRGGVQEFVTVRGEFDFMSTEDGSIHTVATYGEAQDSADKATNKAMAAAFKYACFQAFCIPLEGMGEDADGTTDERAPAPRPAPPAPRTNSAAGRSDTRAQNASEPKTVIGIANEIGAELDEIATQYPGKSEPFYLMVQSLRQTGCPKDYESWEQKNEQVYLALALNDRGLIDAEVVAQKETIRKAMKQAA